MIFIVYEGMYILQLLNNVVYCLHEMCMGMLICTYVSIYMHILIVALLLNCLFGAGVLPSDLSLCCFWICHRVVLDLPCCFGFVVVFVYGVVEVAFGFVFEVGLFGLCIWFVCCCGTYLCLTLYPRHVVLEK